MLAYAAAEVVSAPGFAHDSSWALGIAMFSLSKILLRNHKLSKVGFIGGASSREMPQMTDMSIIRS